MRTLGFTACLLFCVTTAIADPLGSAFTYQGQLSVSGVPANGDYDFQFSLCTAATGNTCASPPITKPGIGIVAGLINTPVDFTDVPYNGAALWVELAIRPAGTGSYTTLAPRQSLTAVPYALFALHGNPGPTGPTGPQGPIGLTGAIGPAGPTGDSGASGTTGATGAMGPQGVQGPAGFVTLPYSGTAATTAAALQVQNSSGPAITAIGTATGIAGAAFQASGSGIGAVITNTSTDTALLLGNNVAGSGGDLIRAFVPAGIFHVDGQGNIVSPAAASFGGLGILSSTTLSVGTTFSNGVAIGVNTNTTGAAVSIANDNDSGYILEGFGSSDSLRKFFINNSGTVVAHGSFIPNGTDYADRLPAAAGLEPGEVLVIGDDGLLHRSTRPSEIAVAGVYSTQPGVIGRHEEEERPTIPVALAGVIPVKATNENGAIHAGDLLVSSSTPGRAMRAPNNPQPGTVIGKAMQSLTVSSGAIEMLVMLR